MKLFMINVGGRTTNSCAEVHDIQFIVGENITECLDALKNRFNYFESMHIDCYKEVNHINGYKIVLKGSSENQLFMIYYGGYNPREFGEVHAIDFIVAKDAVEANKIAKMNMSKYQYIDHVDEITNVAENAGISLSLVEGDFIYDNLPSWQGYHKLF